VFNNNPDKKKDSGAVYKKILRGAKLKTGKRGQKKIAERSPWRRRRFVLDCSAI
jgi:hypothetical protein